MRRRRPRAGPRVRAHGARAPSPRASSTAWELQCQALWHAVLGSGATECIKQGTLERLRRGGASGRAVAWHQRRAAARALRPVRPALVPRPRQPGQARCSGRALRSEAAPQRSAAAPCACHAAPKPRECRRCYAPPASHLRRHCSWRSTTVPPSPQSCCAVQAGRNVCASAGDLTAACAATAPRSGARRAARPRLSARPVLFGALPGTRIRPAWPAAPVE